MRAWSCVTSYYLPLRGTHCHTLDMVKTTQQDFYDLLWMAHFLSYLVTTACCNKVCATIVNSFCMVTQPYNSQTCSGMCYPKQETCCVESCSKLLYFGLKKYKNCLFVLVCFCFVLFKFLFVCLFVCCFFFLHSEHRRNAVLFMCVRSWVRRAQPQNQFNPSVGRSCIAL